MITKALVNDHLRDEKKATIFHAETERISDTLFDHSVIQLSKIKGSRVHSKFSSGNACNPNLLKQAFQRLQGVSITTNITTGGVRVNKGFGLIEWWEIIEKSPLDSRMVRVEVKLSDWLYRAVTNLEVLTLHRDYFRLDDGIERRLYELCRKHCGIQPTWSIGLELLYKKSGS